MNATLFLLTLLLSSQEAPAVVATDEVERPTVVERPGFDQGLLDAVRTIAGQVERIRGERFDRPPLAVRAPDSMRGVAAEIRAYNVLPRARLEARGRAWRDLGLGDGEAAASLLLALAADLEGIAFDREGRRLLVSPDRLTVEDFVPSEEDETASTVLMMTGVRPHEPLVAHFLVHAMQLQREGRDSLDETTDRLLARAMWSEGEANLLAVRYLFEGMGMADEVISLAMDPRDILDGQLVPASVDRLSAIEGAFLDFVYLEGFAQAGEAFLQGGWRALDRAMSRQRTTSQILHDRELDPSREAFAGPPPPAPGAGLTLVDTDSIGEQGIVVLVSALTGKDNLGLMAGDGWAGDRLYRWEPAGGPRVVEGVTLWVTRWARDEDASDFEYALGRMLSARFPGSGVVAPDETGRRRLVAGGRAFEIEREGVEIRLRIGPETTPRPAGPKAD